MLCTLHLLYSEMQRVEESNQWTHHVDLCVSAIRQFYAAVAYQPVSNEMVKYAINNIQSISVQVMRENPNWEKVLHTAQCVAKHDNPKLSIFQLAPIQDLHASLTCLNMSELDKILKSIFIFETQF